MGFENDAKLDARAIKCLCKLANPKLRAIGLKMGVNEVREVEEQIQRQNVKLSLKHRGKDSFRDKVSLLGLSGLALLILLVAYLINSLLKSPTVIRV